MARKDTAFARGMQRDFRLIRRGRFRILRGQFRVPKGHGEYGDRPSSTRNKTTAHVTLRQRQARPGRLEPGPRRKRRFFRPPYGKISLRQYLQLKKKYQIIFWTAISYDWDPQLSPQQCLHKVKAAARRGGIVVFHDNPKAEKNMLEALPRFIRMAKDKGMTFKTFEDR